MATDTYSMVRSKEIDYYCSNWRESERNILLANKKKISEAKIKFCYVYLPKLDGIMHNYGPFSEATQAKLKSLEIRS